MTKKERMAEVVRVLKETVRSDCALEYGGDAFKLAVMARLSAQCTDARVNIVSKELFKRYPTAADMADADITELENLIKSCGLYRSKAKSLKEMSESLVKDYGGEVPSDMDALLSLSGVGRKIANLLRGDLFGLGGVVADTHCIRICGRLGFYPEVLKDAARVEKILTPLVPTEEQTDLVHRLVWFGRDVCTARSPKCDRCPLKNVCKAYSSNIKKSEH